MNNLNIAELHIIWNALRDREIKIQAEMKLAEEAKMPIALELLVKEVQQIPSIKTECTEAMKDERERLDRISRGFI